MATAADKLSNIAGRAEEVVQRKGNQLGKFLDDVEDLLRHVTPLQDSDISRARQRVESSINSVRSTGRTRHSPDCRDHQGGSEGHGQLRAPEPVDCHRHRRRGWRTGRSAGQQEQVGMGIAGLLQVAALHLGSYIELLGQAAVEYRASFRRRLLLVSAAVAMAVATLVAAWTTGLALLWDTNWRLAYCATSLLACLAATAVLAVLATRRTPPGPPQPDAAQ